MIENASDDSYRKTADKIEGSTLTKVSHQTIKNKLDFVGEAIEKLENDRMDKYLKNELKGTRRDKRGRT